MRNAIIIAATLMLAGCQAAHVADFELESGAQALYGYDLDRTRSLAQLKRSPGYMAVLSASLKHGVDPGFMLNVAKVESGGKCNARSRKNAQGVLQVIPGTARIHGIKRGLTNCATGAEAGVREMKRLLVLTKGDWRKALIAYNCGVGCLKRKRLPTETTQYIKKINKRGRYAKNKSR